MLGFTADRHFSKPWVMGGRPILPHRPCLVTFEEMDSGLKVYKLMGIYIYEVATVGTARVADIVLISSEEGASILNSKTGEFYEWNGRGLGVTKRLFSHSGLLALLIGIGRGLEVAKSSIRTEQEWYKVIFVLDAFCVATIHSINEPGAPHWW
jgi:hypothetical protein